MQSAMPILLSEQSTIGEVFFQSADQHVDLPLLVVPEHAGREYAPQGLELSYGQAAAAVRQLMERYRRAGYGLGHRVALLFENRLDHFLHKLALNSLGICCVPLNPDHRWHEMAYVLDHARVDLIVALESWLPALHEVLASTKVQPQAVGLGAFDKTLATAKLPAKAWQPVPETIASLLYTSGTTGRPKGCLLSHRYELAAGQWYATRGGLATFNHGSDRIYNPLPVFHINASVYSFFCAVLTGNCQVQPDRFHPSRWWTEVRQTGATVVHYLGVVIPMLLNQTEGEQDRDHPIRFGVGAGVDPTQHARFEARFGFPLIEVWGMTEAVRTLTDCELPRRVGTWAVGRAQPGLEVRVVDDNDVPVADGTQGEMVVRYSADTPRKHFFSGYLDDAEATELAWRGGWFHTGDIVVRDADGLVHFVERRKNIIRRSGENIAAAEVEALLQTHPAVQLCVVMAVTDEVRGEEVLACVVPKAGATVNAQLVRELFDFCNTRMAYYKAPGWLWFTTQIPTTSTQKVQKHQLFAPGTDPRLQTGMHDLRSWKKRQPWGSK